MEDLLAHYEYELGLIADALAEFGKRYPRIAARLGLSNGHSDEPHVERLSQAFAFLAARIGVKLGDDYPEFTEPLLELLYPGYLRTVPSCAIAQFDPSPVVDLLTEPQRVERGTELDALAAHCRFTTVHDVTLSTLRIDAARFAPAIYAPSTVQLPPDASGLLSIAFSAITPTQRFDDSVPSSRVRVHLAGTRALVCALLDAMLLHARAAFVEADDSGRWKALPVVPFEQVGFGDDDRLLPCEAPGASTPFQCLLEYFAFPELFDFVDIDLGRVRRAAGPAARITLHVAVSGAEANSAAGRALHTLDASALKLGCTPVINLFTRPAAPIVLTPMDTRYPVRPVPLAADSVTEVFSIDSVWLGELAGTEKTAPRTDRGTRIDVQPFRAFGHRPGATGSTVYWIAARDRDAALVGRNGDLLLSLVGLDGKPARPAQPQVDVETTATNGDLPPSLPVGSPHGDLSNEQTALSCPIRLLAPPTRPAELPCGDGALWRLLSALTPHAIELTQAGLPSLKALFEQHAARSSPTARRCIDALTSLGWKPAIEWMSLDDSFPSFVRGMEITVGFDEAALVDVSLSVFAAILARFFESYASTNNFVRLVVRSARTGAVLIRCPARRGARPLV
ncbi:MAG: type VI secretion system baseplate subunit TssF [Trinickia sp.]|uniref:type VI secretion system baseplate subunit TssF n=1 Tax=Trinickia sp. TaxID=2571163 RepID=UPI003F7F748E